MSQARQSKNRKLTLKDMIHHLTESGQGASISVSTENGCFFKGSAAFYLASAGKIEHYFFETTGAFAESGPSHGPEENPVPLLKREVISSEKKNGIWEIVVEGREFGGIGMSLREFLPNAGRRVRLFIGSGSGYFFVGTSNQFFRNIKEIERSINGMCDKNKKEGKPVNPGPKTPLPERKVLDIYKKWAEDGYAVIVEGKEIGGFWTAEEYEAEKKKKEGLKK